MRRLRVIDGMSLDVRYGFEPEDTFRVFVGHRLMLVRPERIQLGLNHLFVFRKDSESPGTGNE